MKLRVNIQFNLMKRKGIVFSFIKERAVIFWGKNYKENMKNTAMIFFLGKTIIYKYGRR